MIRKLLATSLLALCLLGAGCTTVPKGAAQTVYAVQTSYVAALTLAVQYKALPICFPEAPSICSNAVTLQTLQSADDTAYIALQAAQQIVRNKNAQQSDIEKAIADAQTAVNAFSQIASRLQLK